MRWLGDGARLAQRTPFTQTADRIERSLPSALFRWGDALVTEQGQPSAPVNQSVNCVSGVC